MSSIKYLLFSSIFFSKIETQKYKEEQLNKSVLITFHADRQILYDQQVFFRGGHLFLQSIYYRLHLDKACRKLRDKYKFKYDVNAILSDLIYARVLEPASKRSTFSTVSKFLEPPSYQIHDVYRALDILGNECDFIQSEVYKNSHLLGPRNDKILYYDCTNALNSKMCQSCVFFKSSRFIYEYTAYLVIDSAS